MHLGAAKRGQTVKITAITDGDVRDQAIRFGIAEGEVVTCAEVIPAGPVVVRKGQVEVAIGRGLARKIAILPLAFVKDG